MGTFNEEPLRKDLELTDAEEALVAGAETGTTAQANKVRTYADLYVTKKLQGAIDRLIQSNEKLSLSNDRYARAMNWLTGGLLLVAFLQVLLQVILPLVDGWTPLRASTSLSVRNRDFRMPFPEQASNRSGLTPCCS